MSARRVVACAIVIAAALPATVPAQVARVRGRVFDSLTALPLAGARVEFVNADDRARIVFSATSDSLGRFVVDSVARGRYIAGFLHPLLDSLGLAFTQRQLTVNADGDVRVDLAVPAPERIQAALCGRGTEKDTTGVLLGYVLNAHSFGAIDTATVIAQWAEISLGESGMSRMLLYRTTRTDAEGWFALCGVPAATSVVVRAVSGTDTSGAIEIDVPKTRIARRVLYVDHALGADTTGVRRDSGAAVAGTREAASAKLMHGTVNGWVRTEDGDRKSTRLNSSH